MKALMNYYWVIDLPKYYGRKFRSLSEVTLFMKEHGIDSKYMRKKVEWKYF